MSKLFYQEPITVIVPTNATNVVIPRIELDKNYNHIVGIAVEFGENANADLINATSLASDMMADQKRILPRGFDLKRLVSGAQLDPNKRYLSVCRSITCGAIVDTSVITNSSAFPGGGFAFKIYFILSKEPVE